ncbi:LamG-like jellyroll fold domain-containing protein [Thomasclavelia spiroformis]|uniref:LamG-like jellyroll fold domain-containing protein n=1 Tax=Thomasclavelia spiroformis TaxID=29348 RepID=UPI00267463E7|nr:LamG-like jellyroll fold domain-containing protein [Thomasclavelia spiroformis]
MKRKLKKISLLLLVITVFFASTNICSYALNEEILLHVNFDENVQDLSGNENDGSVKGEVEYVDGIKGKAIHIVNSNGSTSQVANQYVDFGKNIRFNNNDFAISFWYKSDNGVSAGGALISNKNFDSGSNPGLNIGNFDTGLRVNFTPENSGRYDVYNFAPIDGVWHYVAINFDRDGTIDTYVDNQFIQSTNIADDFDKSIDVANFVVGADGYFKNGLNDAYIDELKVYSKLMSEQEIADNYNLNNDEILYLNFNEENANDISGNENHGQAFNVTYSEGIDGKAAHIVNTNGSTSAKAEQYIDFGNDIKFTDQDFALSFWYKSDNGVSNGGALISNKDFDSGSNKGFNIGNFDTGLRVNFTPENSERYDVYNFAPIDGIWHYVVVNFDRDGYIETFVDNKVMGRTDISNEINKSIDVSNFVVGADGYFKNGLNDAYVDELNVFSRLMDVEEIESQYNTTYLQYVVNEADKFYQEALKNIKYDKAKLANLYNSIENARTAIKNEDYSKIDELVNDINIKLAAVKEGIEGVVEGQVLYLSFDNENVKDESGRENHGISVGDVTYENGVIGKALHIQNENGSTMETAKQYVNFGQPDDLKFKTEDFAISFWYKTVDGGGKEAAIISNKDWSTGSNVGINIGNFGNSIRVNYTGQGCNRDDIYGLSANDDNWHYIVVNFDRDKEVSAYIDGNLEKTMDIKDTYGKTIDATDFVIGADGNKTQGINDAYIDEVRIMKRLFSSEEIDTYYLPYRFQITEMPIMSFQVLSDVHIDGSDDNNKSRQNLIDALEDISVLDPTSSAVMFPGDITDSGSEAQYESFYDIIEKYNFTKSIIALGNHDVRWLCSSDDRNEPGANVPTCKYGTSPFKERYLKYNTPYMDGTTDELYFDTWINDYHFITLNTEKDLKDNAYLSNEQLNWLKDVIKEDAHKDKPIFIQIHQTFTNTADHESLDLIGEQEEALKEILKDYPQSIIFTGHVHNGIDLAKVYQEEYGYVVDVPAFKYQSYGDSRAQIGYQVNVFEDRVEIRPRDYKNDLWLDEYKTGILFDKEIDKTTLQTLYDECLTLKESEYTSESWSSFKTAMDEAKAIIDKQDVTQEEVNNAFDRLANAMQKLEFFKGDKTALKAFIDKVSDLDSFKYTESTWSAFDKELNEANVVYNNVNAMQEEVNTTYSELVKAFLNLRLIPDKSLLEDLINQAEGLDSANYTKASFDGLTKALNEAKVVFENPNATQVEVDNAKATLEKAIVGLQANPSTPSNVDNTVSTPVNNGDTTSVKTGDESLVGMFATITLLSVTGYAVLRRKEN